MAPRIRSLTVKGFRAFGAVEQTLNLTADIAAVWGPNSKGKTSLAEAFEFLLTGQISRRELMGSSQDEFADALRNAHLPEGESVYVAARIVGPDGSTHQLRRTLVRDYAKRQDCASTLELDGSVVSEDALATIGISLSQPPMRVPILAQHTLAYIFSVRPQDRATFFKALLEVTDLDRIRDDIASQSAHLEAPASPVLTSFDNCRSRPLIGDHLATLPCPFPDLNALGEGISRAIAALLESVNQDVPESLTARAAALEEHLNALRGRTFPVNQFSRQPLSAWHLPSEDIWQRLESFLQERSKVDRETQRLIALFVQALELPEVATISSPIDCSLCGTEASLTPERVELLRSHVEGAGSFRSAETKAKSALGQLAATVRNVRDEAESAVPRFMRSTGAERRRAGFTLTRLRSLLGDDADELVDPWLSQVRPLARARAALVRTSETMAERVTHQLNDLSTLDPEALRKSFDALEPLHASLEEHLQSYRDVAALLIAALKSVLDQASDTEGWEDLIRLARNPKGLREVLLDREARAVVSKELSTALRQIDKAKEQVLQDKFAEYSTMIGKWWEALRPDESTYFTAVRPRKGAKRTIDFKAALSLDGDRSSPQVRDVIAVFSQSQLHCLGLALFLARAEHEGRGFVVLDDPILSSDEDYRVHFNTTVLSELVDIPVQVIVLTQDHGTWEELENRYRHLGISTAQLFMESPAEGSVIDNTSDALLAKITRARSLARGGHPDSRKECGIHLRDAGELFCKEMLVKAKREGGNLTASLSDYDGKTLEWLCQRVDPLLDQDPSHPGKLQAFKNTANDACHDNVPPSTGAMTHACGEINYLQRGYLPR